MRFAGDPLPNAAGHGARHFNCFKRARALRPRHLSWLLGLECPSSGRLVTVTRASTPRRLAPSMTVTTSEMLMFEQRLLDHGLSLPQTFEIVVLPSRALSSAGSDTLHRESEASTLRKVFAAEGFAVVELAPKTPGAGIRIQKASDLLFPAIVVAYQLLIDDPARLRALVDTLATYVVERLPRPKRQVRFQIVLQGKARCYREITYDGPAEGLRDLERVLRELSND
jgi:hypothetical protein